MQTTQTKPAELILPLTSVRFLAAFYVVLHHSNFWAWHLDSSTFLGRLLRSGLVGVGFFFVLSGFILALVYLDTEKPFHARRFWLARFARIYPLFLFSILATAPAYLLGWVDGVTHSLRNTLLNVGFGALMLQSWAQRFRELNAPAWSLSTEAIFYLTFPVLGFILWRRRHPVAVLALLWLLALLAPVAVVHHNPTYFYQQGDARARIQYFIQLNPVFRIFEFLAGVALCALNRALPAERRARLANPSLLAAVALFLPVIAFAERIPVMVLNNGLLLPVFCLLIFALANAQGALRLLFSHRWFVLLGEVSYAIYLLHNPLYFYFVRFAKITSAGPWLLFIAILLLLSFAAFFGIERPMRKAILAFAHQRPRRLIEQEIAAPN